MTKNLTMVVWFCISDTKNNRWKDTSVWKKEEKLSCKKVSVPSPYFYVLIALQFFVRYVRTIPVSQPQVEFSCPSHLTTGIIFSPFFHYYPKILGGEDWMIIEEGQVFMRSYDSAPRPPCPPSLVSKLPLFLSLPVYRRQCCGSGSGRIRNFLPDPDPE